MKERWKVMWKIEFEILSFEVLRNIRHLGFNFYTAFQLSFMNFSVINYPIFFTTIFTLRNTIVFRVISKSSSLYPTRLRTYVIPRSGIACIRDSWDIQWILPNDFFPAPMPDLFQTKPNSTKRTNAISTVIETKKTTFTKIKKWNFLYWVLWLQWD